MTDAAAASPEEIVRSVAQAGARKARIEAAATMMLAAMAGAFIAFGAVFASTIGAGTELGAGPTRLLMGLGFSVGLFFVVVTGAELFTGNSLMITSLLTRQIGIGKVARNWTLVYFGNLFGSLVIVLMVFYGRWWELADLSFGGFSVAVADAKVDLGFMAAFLRGVLANMLVCLAVWMAAAGRTTTDKLLGVALPIAAFVAAGFEHSIANMYFTPLGVLVAAESGTIEAAGLTHNDVDGLTVAGVIGNLIPVTLGNIVGGVLVGLANWAVHLRRRIADEAAEAED